MSRTQSQGIEFFPTDVDFFSDKKVKILIARYGADGLAVLLYLLCTIYREGYYTRVDEDTYFIISSDLNLSVDKVRQVLKFLLERSMFDNTLFMSDTILTSTGIQERWQKAISTRAAKTPIKVSKYWLLNKDETKPFIKCTCFSDSSEKKDDNSEKKDDNSENYSQSKVKESKVNISPIIPLKTNEEELLENFHLFWKIYPKKVGEDEAFESYKDAVQTGVSFEELSDGARRYGKYVLGTDVKFIKSARNWLRKKCWKDKYSDSEVKKSGTDLELFERMLDQDDAL